MIGHWGNQADAGNARFAFGEVHDVLPFVVIGETEPSSQWGDQPGIHYEVQGGLRTDDVAKGFTTSIRARGSQFTARGDTVTRAAALTTHDSNLSAVSAKYHGQIWTRSGSGTPLSVVGCADLSVDTDSKWIGSVDPNAATLPMFWVFSGGLAVTSGDDYVFVVEYNDNATASNDVKWLIHSPVGFDRPFFLDGTGEWDTVDGSEHIHEIWYTSSGAAPSSPPPGGGGGITGFNRSFPAASRRSFPIGAIREFPRQ